MKPRLPVAPLTQEDGAIWGRVINRRRDVCHTALSAKQYHGVTLAADRRDADLMLGLTGWPCGQNGVCVAHMFLTGSVIRNWAVGTNIATRAYCGQNWTGSEDITYFA